MLMNQLMRNPKIERYSARNGKFLQKCIDQTPILAPPLKEAVQYCLFPGGKRLRPVLVYLCGEITGASPACLDVIATAIELTHAYSLIHDDLPAMDNDDLRRGRPTCHRAFDEATAILVGDGMQALAIEILLTQLPPLLPANTVIHIAQDLITASGFSGMVSGQSLDLSELSQPHITEAQLQRIHRLKTGALFSACINMALHAGTPSAAAKQALRSYARDLGLVFQMQDDYLDRYHAKTVLGKNGASDLINQKTTFASLFNQPTLKDLIDNTYKRAFLALETLSDEANSLRDLTLYLQQRTQC